VHWKIKLKTEAKSTLKVDDVQWTNEFDLKLDYDLKSSIDQDEHLGHYKAQTNRIEPYEFQLLSDKPFYCAQFAYRYDMFYVNHLFLSLVSSLLISHCSNLLFFFGLPGKILFEGGKTSGYGVVSHKLLPLMEILWKCISLYKWTS